MANPIIAFWRWLARPVSVCPVCADDIETHPDGGGGPYCPTCERDTVTPGWPVAFFVLRACAAVCGFFIFAQLIS